jgi:hypothetical protein
MGALLCVKLFSPHVTCVTSIFCIALYLYLYLYQALYGGANLP